MWQYWIHFFKNTMLAKQNMYAGQIQAPRHQFTLSALCQLNPRWFPLFHYGDILMYAIYFAENLESEPS